jgi:hypothetical protein
MKIDQGPQRLSCLRAARNKLVAARATFDETDWYNKPTVISFLSWLVHQREVDAQSVQYNDEAVAADYQAPDWASMFCADTMESTVKDILTVKYGACL